MGLVCGEQHAIAPLRKIQHLGLDLKRTAAVAIKPARAGSSLATDPVQNYHANLAIIIDLVFLNRYSLRVPKKEGVRFDGLLIQLPARSRVVI